MEGDFELDRRSVLRWAESGGGAGEGFEPAREKYAIEAPIGRGGMGEVFLVTDQDLRRQVAMKILREDVSGREQWLHFVGEAQATSQLEHPGIPPVHDIGVAKDGRIWFTMKLVRGRTLREVLHDLLLKRREVQEQYTLHRLVTVLERIAETMHFAHERGVIHRDLKPENVMLGDYGEVHVMDWGLARIGTESSRDLERVETARTREGVETEHGAIKGTLAYMSPEQASGETEALDRRTDVYAMGCLLYEMLTLQQAFDPAKKDLLDRVLNNDHPPVETRNPRRPVPQALADTCRKAMSKQREDRHASAKDLATELREWLDGSSERERRHEEAESLAAQGREAATRYERLQTEVGEAEAAAGEEERKYHAWQPIDEKRPLLEARKRAEDKKTEVALAFAETLKYLQAALVQEETNPTARAALAMLWKGRLESHERRGDKVDAAYALTMVKRYDDGPLVPFVKGEGSLALASEPSGAEVRLFRYVERDAVLEAQEERRLGSTPLPPVALPMGSYLCIVTKPGFRDVRYPVHITRNREWKGKVRLRTDEEIGEGFVYVPAGPFVYGEGKDTRTLELPDFAIGKYPVTRAEYAEFLTALDPEEAAERMSRNEYDGVFFERGEKGAFRPINKIEGKALEWSRRMFGEDFVGRLPASCMSWDDARAFCVWRTRTTGKQWRLPTEEEREKAARGVDGRRFPWGDLEDSSLAKCRDSREVNPQPEPVGAFKTAESVYGMGDAAGGIWDWTDSWFDEAKGLRAMRGGSWGDPPPALRAAVRYWLLPVERFTNGGFRCASDLRNGQIRRVRVDSPSVPERPQAFVPGSPVRGRPKRELPGRDK